MTKTIREHPQRAAQVTFETFDMGYEEKWPDQQNVRDKEKVNDNDEDIWRTPSKSDPRDFMTFDQSDEETWPDQNRHWQWILEKTLNEQN